jgi:hypothetical protein
MRDSKSFDDSLDFRAIDFRRRPDLYRIGWGEQGVLLVEPYKGEILPHWRFKTVAEAKKSSARIYKLFLAYLKADDFPGADMARKFLQIGWTRARRYANHAGGRKYDRRTGKGLQRTEDAEKAAAAAIFYERYVAARQSPGTSAGSRCTRRRPKERDGPERRWASGTAPKTCTTPAAADRRSERKCRGSSHCHSPSTSWRT